MPLAPRQWRLIEIDASLEGMQPHMGHLLRLLDPATTVMDLNIGTAVWWEHRQPLDCFVDAPHPGVFKA
jgi:hypothetical protein